MTNATQYNLRHRQNEMRRDNALHNAKRILRCDGVLGGYDYFAIMEDGGTLCVDCVRDEWRTIVHSTRGNYRDGWHIMAMDSTGNTDSFVGCDHCSKIIRDDWEVEA